jgi:glutathione synthase/RimK-type ligase-like ATP-grasp enzyme
VKIAIQKSPTGFSADWITFCEANKISYKIVDCYRFDIIEQIADCDALLWHFHHTSAKDFLFAKQLLYAVQHSGKVVFPDFATSWHFDDKVGQKYLLEAIRAPLATSYTFYDKQQALSWVDKTSFPKVFKLRGGAGSNNVKLVHNVRLARKLVHRAFGRGFPNYDARVDLREKWRRYRLGKGTLHEVARSIRRLFVSTQFARMKGPERGYVYFQDFVPGNTYDIRIVTIGNRAFGIKRMVRGGDFRASGSGFIQYSKADIDERCIKLAFEISDQLKAQVVAYDFVFRPSGEPCVVEINFGYAHQSYFACPGFWDRNMEWHEGAFNSADWIMEEVIQEINSKKRKDEQSVHR